MGNCLCVKPDLQEEVLRSDKNKSKKDSNEKQSYEKSKEEFDFDKIIQNSTTRVTKKKSNNKLSCDEYWDEIRENSKYETFHMKNEVSKIFESKKDQEESRKMTIQTNTNYSITIIEVNNKLVNPDEVFFVPNKENISRPASPKPNTKTKNNLKTNNKNLDLDQKITDSIKSNIGFDKLYEDILSKHLCKK